MRPPSRVAAFEPAPRLRRAMPAFDHPAPEASIRLALLAAVWRTDSAALAALLALPAGRAQLLSTSPDLPSEGGDDQNALDWARAMEVDAADPLIWAITEGWPEGVAAMLAGGAPPNGANPEWRPLLRSIVDEDIDIVRMLVDAGASLDALDDFGNSALHLAANNPDPEIAELLLDLRPSWAKKSQRNSDGITPLGHAIRRDWVKTASSLLNRGADPDATMRGGRTPLTLAIECGSSEGLALLVKRGASIDLMTPCGTALAAAVAAHHPAMAKLLLNAGADPRVKAEGAPSAAEHAGRLNFLLDMKSSVLDRAKLLDERDMLHTEIAQGREAPRRAL